MLLLSLVFATLVSEDLTCIAAGLLVQRGEVGAVAAVLACAIGIFAGDLGLWALGRICGEVVLSWPRIAGSAGRDRVAVCHQWLTHHAAWAIVGSRFLPGTRLPLYVIAGFVRMPATVFCLWAAVGTSLWTPTLVLLSATLDRGLRHALPASPALGWLASLGSAAAVLLVLRIITNANRHRTGHPTTGVPAGV